MCQADNFNVNIIPAALNDNRQYKFHGSNRRCGIQLYYDAMGIPVYSC
jgi:hypothetical protein